MICIEKEYQGIFSLSIDLNKQLLYGVLGYSFVFHREFLPFYYSKVMCSTYSSEHFSNINNSTVRNESDFNSNWPVLGRNEDGSSAKNPAVSILSINSNKNDEDPRMILNLRAMIEGYDGELQEANISFPESWGKHSKFSVGEKVHPVVALSKDGVFRVQSLEKQAIVGFATRTTKKVSASEINAELENAQVLESAKSAVAEAIATPAPVVATAEADMPF